jgi:hypothetical protein
MPPVPLDSLEKKLEHDGAQEPVKTACPLDSSSFLGIIFVSWLSPLIRTGYKKPLQQEDLSWELPTVLQAQNLAAQFRAAWTDKTRVEYIMFRAFWRPWAFGGLLKFCYCCFYLVQPMIIGRLLEWLTDKDETRKDEGYILAFCLLASSVCVTICINTGFHYAYLTGQKVRACMMGEIFKKTLKLQTTVVAEQQGNINSVSPAARSTVIAVIYSHFSASAHVCRNGTALASADVGALVVDGALAGHCDSHHAVDPRRA